VTVDRNTLLPVARRLGWATAVLWTVLTACFLLLASLPPTRLVGFSEVEMGLATLDRTSGGLPAAYVDWLTAVVTLQWGVSPHFGEPVVALFARRIPVTVVYLLPSVVVAVAVGTLVTTYAAVDREGPLARAVSGVGVAGLAVPAFLLANVVFVYTTESLGIVRLYDPELGLWHTQNLLRLQAAGAIVGLSLLGVQVRHVRSEAVEHLTLPFVKTAWAKGAGRRRVAAHVFRTAWPSAASLVVGESLGVLLLATVAVETVLEFPGVGRLVFLGFVAGDPMVSVVAVVGTVVVGVAGTLGVELLRSVFDPRVRR
jgi:peptide/nickel transport system permease protein